MIIRISFETSVQTKRQSDLLCPVQPESNLHTEFQDSSSRASLRPSINFRAPSRSPCTGNFKSLHTYLLGQKIIGDHHKISMQYFTLYIKNDICSRSYTVPRISCLQEFVDERISC